MPKQLGKITFKDYIKISVPPGVESSHWYDFYSSGVPGRKGLRVRFEATHAGYINDNLKFYIPSRMSDGVSTFRTGEKPTKILKHHNPEQDPIGLVRSARFVPTVPDDLRNHPDIINLMSSSTPIKAQIKSVKNLIKSGIVARDGWRGLGYIELIADILDKDSIEKVMDGRLDAISTYFRSPGATYCMHCMANWGAGDMCEHEPFEMYSDSEDEDIKLPAIPIAGIHKYIEASLVSIEGDKLVTAEIMDNSNLSLSSESISNMDSLGSRAMFEFKDFFNNEEDPKMTEKEKAIFDIVKQYKVDMSDESAESLAKRFAATLDESGNLPNQVDAGIDFATAVQYAVDDSEFDGKDMTDEIAASVDALYLEEFSKMKDEKLLTDVEFADAKLSTEKRKNLPDTSFCGPGKSFPVPDCAHVTAARRLIGRYKGPGSKSSILACVSRKAKALGCSSGDSLDANQNSDNTQANDKPCFGCELKDMSEDSLKTLFESVSLEMSARNLIPQSSCKDCSSHLANIKSLEDEKAELIKKISTGEDSIKKMQDTLVILRSELRRTNADHIALVDQYVEQGAKLKDAKIDKAIQVGVLSGKYNDITKARDELVSKDINSIELLFADFDIMKIANKLNDGMANRQPEGIVDNPGVNTDADNLQIESLDAPAKAALENMIDFICDNDTRAAKHIYDTMKSMKFFPDALTFEKILTIAKKQ